MKKDLGAMRALIVHESFHGLHLGQLNKYFTINYGDQSNLFSIIHRERLAVYATEEICPIFPKAGLVEENILQYEKNFLLLAKEFLYDQKASDFLKYRKYIGVPSNDPTIPEKFGYWLGYRVIKELIKKYPLQEGEFAFSVSLRSIPSEPHDDTPAPVKMLYPADDRCQELEMAAKKAG